MLIRTDGVKFLCPNAALPDPATGTTSATCTLIYGSHIYKPIALTMISNLSRRFLSGDKDVSKLVLKIGSVRLPVAGAVRPEFVPARVGGSGIRSSNNEILTHLKWLLQKEILGQDTFLMGVPGSSRTNIALEYLELCNREYEYLAVTRDTTEADIKQRREIRGGTAFYTDLCAVRAALQGRVLVIDGVEKAERNVLPILNNLLENREMQLDDGRYLMHHDKYDKLKNNYTPDQLRAMGIERVSERFHVIALGLPVPKFPGNSLDPPLRSRFQCRTVPEPSFESTRRLCSGLAPNVSSNSISDLISMIYAINSQSELGIPRVSMELLPRIMRIWNINPLYSAVNMFDLVYPCRSMFKEYQTRLVEDFVKKFISERTPPPSSVIASVEMVDNETRKADIWIEQSGNRLTFTTDVTKPSCSEERDFVSTPQHETLLANLAIAHSQGDFALIGNKGSGKTKLVGELAARLGFTTDTMVLYQDMNSRELFQRRRMLDSGDTLWEDSQLVAAAKRGDVCVLDGVEKVHWSTLESLGTLCHHRLLFLPDGSRMVGEEEFRNIQERTGYDEALLSSRGVFRIPRSFRLVLIGDTSAENVWLKESVMSLMPFLQLQKLTNEEQCCIINEMVPPGAAETTRKLINFVERLRSSSDAGLRGVALSLSMRKLIHIVKRDCLHPGELRGLVENASLAKFLPSVTRLSFYAELDKAGFAADSATSTEFSDDVSFLLSQHSVQDRNEALIPDVLFYDNDQHMSIIRNMARDMRLGAHLLLIGNQGVGKNKITDRFLHLIQRPRHYMQLHRDTTVESLTMQTTVENGVLRYEDSALVRAARDGHVLVVDEADKAPLHVVAFFKSLLDSGTLLLGDGRRIQPASAPPRDRSIILHPDFRIIMLANRPGFPFLGNDLFGVLGDLFSVHMVDNPSRESELDMLKKYAPDVENATLLKLMAAFTELREMVNDGVLQYPYSIRELVNIAKHINKFPEDSITAAIRNVFDFDSFSTDAVKLIQEVFQKHGVPFGIEELSKRIFLSHRFPIDPSSPVGVWGLDSSGVSVEVNTNEAHLIVKDDIPMKYKSLKLVKEHMRTKQFTEQDCAWQIPMLDVNICSDGLVVGNTLVVATVNPPRLYLMRDLNEANQVHEVDISPMFKSLRHLLKYQPRLTLSTCGNEKILVHEEVTNSMCIVDLKRDLIQHINLGSSAFDSLAKILNSSEYRLVRGASTLFARDGKQLFVIKEDGFVTLMNLKEEISNVFLLQEDRYVVKQKNGSYGFLFREGNTWKLQSISTNFTTPIDIDGICVHENSVHLSDENFYFLKSGFPLSLDSKEVLGSARHKLSDVVDIRRPHYLSDEETKKFVNPQRNFVIMRDGVVVRAQPNWNVPKDALKEAKHGVHNVGGFLEAVDSVNGLVQYVPVPSAKHQSYHGSWISTISRTQFVIVPYSDDKVLTVDTNGGVRSFELSPTTLGRSYNEWNHLVGGTEDQNLRIEFEREPDAFDISKLLDPKIGKFDPSNAPHHGGNQWMGGTGGYSTAGLGGVGGPFRLDAGHDVHQMPDSAKQRVPEHILKKAREISRAEYQKKLKEIAMSEYDGEAYMSLWNKIEKHSTLLRSIIEQLEAKEKERQWARHQTSGDLDDGKLIEGIVGERNIYKRRIDKLPELGAPQLKPKKMRLCFDVSGSMYRFNGYDQRLNKSLEAALMVMTSFEGKHDKITYDIVGHSGDGPCIEFVTKGHYPKNNKERLDILKQMLAHTQFCASGDFTVEGLDDAMKTLSKEKDCDERFVVLISDANLDRYGISPKDLLKVMNRHENVRSFVILIGSLGQQAVRLQASLPVGKAFVCENMSDLPKIMQNIFTSTLA
ncbi:hypothetical protein RB195_011638 [Necator americanus]|uniref:VWFA domain-containing protein n=1 Tax=Necator americanus TaxID=51031 RepID=A0ABR1D5B4_NECAM